MLVKPFGDDLSWDVQRQLVNTYFKVKEIVNEELSPELQVLQGILNQLKRNEMENRERDRQIALAQRTAEKAVKTTEKIKDEFIQPFENWRDDVNRKVCQISRNSGIPYQQLFSDMYKELERAGFDLTQRQKNKRARMVAQGCAKKEIERETTKLAIIDGDKKAKKIFENIVSRYAVKYIA